MPRNSQQEGPQSPKQQSGISRCRSSAAGSSVRQLHEHSLATTSDIIDGALNPELIHYSDAYRLYFVAVSEMPNPSDEQKARQMSHLNKIGLGDSDLKSAIVILEDFKVRYTNLIAHYNESVEAAQKAGTKADLDTFLAQRDALVQATRDSVTGLLTPEGVTRLDGHIQREKHNMKVAAKEKQ